MNACWLSVVFLVALLLSAAEGRARRRSRRHSSRSAYCRISPQHTLCKYKGHGESCSPMLSGEVSQADKTNILDIHNSYRQKVAEGSEFRGLPGPQPPAANMREMVWDEELARIAQRWADQCRYSHDISRSVKRFDVGQNIYAWSTNHWDPDPAPEWNVTLKSLYDEVKLYNGHYIEPFHYSFPTSHYTVMVWADTFAVGCGYSMYRKPGERTWTDKFYVCNYGPVGNILDDAMYEVGTACSHCPRRTSCRNGKYPALCS